MEENNFNGDVKASGDNKNNEFPMNMNGPDQILPSNSLTCTDRDGAVNLRIDEDSKDNEYKGRKPISIISFFETSVSRMPNHNALAYKTSTENWEYVTYREYLDTIRVTAKAFIKLGLQRFHGVGIIGFNSPEWFYSDLGAIFAGGFAVGIYTTNSPEACQYVCNHAKCDIIVVENKQQLAKILEIKKDLPDLKAIVQYKGKPDAEDVLSWEDLQNIGRKEDETELCNRKKQIAINQCSTLIYTSGTTGSPKGVMLSHDNCTWTSNILVDIAKLKFGSEHLISYLPLSHIAAQMVDIYLSVAVNATIYFAQPDALKGSLSKTLREVRPTAFLGVPRVWEKIQEKITEIGKSVTGIRRSFADWAKDVGYRGTLAKMNNTGLPWGWTIANMVLFKKIKKNLGLDRCNFCLTAAAPITMDTLDFFYKLDIPVVEVYGMSESTGPHTVSMPWNFLRGSVGNTMLGADTKINKDALENNDDAESGEICMYGRHVMMGYLNASDKTSEAIDDQGYLKSGDIGKFDANKYLFITGRLKELIITAGGENVAPVPIEDSVKEFLPIIANCMLIGDKKKFLTMLLTLKTVIDTEGVPTDNLSDVALDWCKAIGSTSKTIADIIPNKDSLVLKAIQQGIDKANNKSTSRAQKIQKWTILPRDFSVSGGELGPTLKLRRPIVTKMYAKTIDSFYEERME